MNNIEELKKQANELLAKIEKLEQAKAERFPACGERYFIAGALCARNFGNNNRDITEWHRATVGVFKTEADAEKYSEILNKIIELNLEQGWVADWSDEGQHKYYFYAFNDKVRHAYICCRRDQGTVYMSEQTHDKIREQYTDAELRLFVRGESE